MGEHESPARVGSHPIEVIDQVQRENKIETTRGEHNTETVKPGKLKPLKTKKQGQSHKSKRKLIVNVPGTDGPQEVDNKVFPKASAGLTKTLEGIQEDCDDNSKVAVNGVNSTHTSLKGVPHQLEEKIHENENSKGKGNDNGGLLKPHPSPLVRSSTVGSILLKKLVRRRSTDDLGLRRKSDTTPTMIHRSGTELSFATPQSDVILPASARTINTKIKRSKSVAGWSKRELEIFLPRKTFFNTHDTTLSHAGFDIRSDEERKRPDWRKFMKMRTTEELYPPKPKKEETVASSFANNGIIDLEDDDDEEFSLEDVVTSLTADGDKEAGHTKRKLRHAAKKLTLIERDEYKPLYDYIKYIHDTPDDYIHMAKFNPKNIDHRHPDRLVRLGRAFRRGHHGTPKNNIYLHAIADLKQAMPEVPNLKPGRTDKPIAKKESNEHNDTTANVDETEIEKLKVKAEKWMRGLTTQQILRAKENALKDIGEEDVTHSKWWIAFKTCKYIRVLHHHPDSTHH